MAVAGSLTYDTKIDKDGFESGLESLKNIGKATFTAIGVAAAGVTTAIGAITKSAVEAYSSNEQLVGGVETLFKSSANVVKKYANDAYKTAGLSANAYMETVTGFSASLLQSLGGDTAKSAEYANSAVVDMSDNANKMGTSMESIQFAYQGFAKQNYTMLDNLKLGYGGTKEEMQRLLVDAEKISGIHYDISNFADVTQAIHVMQTSMGIAGTTAKEASTTIEGSVNSMKSAWTNFLTGLGDKNANMQQLVDNLVQSVQTVLTNVIPIIQNVLTSISNTMPQIITEIVTYLPQFLQTGMQLLQSIFDGIMTNLPLIMQGIMQVIQMILNAFITNLPQILQMGITILVSLIQGLAQALPQLIPAIVNAVVLMVETLIDNIDLIIDAGIQIIFGLIEGIINALPQLIDKIPEIIDKLVNAIVDNLPKLIEMGIILIVKLAERFNKSYTTININNTTNYWSINKWNR